MAGKAPPTVGDPPLGCALAVICIALLWMFGLAVLFWGWAGVWPPSLVIVGAGVVIAGVIVASAPR